MIQEENPTLICAGAVPVNAAFSNNPMQQHAYSGKRCNNTLTAAKKDTNFPSHLRDMASAVPSVAKIPLDRIRRPCSSR
ncbi:hypothetical protein [Neptunicoccus cionae]|uniref:hypothetical protein n=1 Tax=Neptunicoccus cionae TaxID=2035344 RepID=UPI001667FE98|nr:hypothetical protein [Amylibacter cionae]